MITTLLQGMGMGGPSDSLEHAYFWVAIMIAITPVVVFGYIGYLVTRGYFRAQREARGGQPSPRIRIKLAP
ncbi:MAG TPA: hypothetical protein VLT79_11015 [Gemmatimonadales bacterium]|nr:hypothetical protein [Gemmatimonadales bacterium]